MNIFKKNNCRLCTKIFCCQQCREKHEENIHNINLTCGICTYGKMYIRNMDGELLKHLEESHWPLNCINCKKIFKSTADLESYSKCVKIKNNNKPELNPATPINVANDYFDPSSIQSLQKDFVASNALLIFLNSTLYPTTSTPLHPNENFFEKMPANLTPSDSDEVVEIEKKTIFQITPTNYEPKRIEDLKRKVTFLDTLNSENQAFQKVHKVASIVPNKELKCLMIEENYVTISKSCTMSNSDKSLKEKNENNQNLNLNDECPHKSPCLSNQKQTKQERPNMKSLDENDSNVNKLESENETIWKSAIGDISFPVDTKQLDYHDIIDKNSNLLEQVENQNDGTSFTPETFGNCKTDENIPPGSEKCNCYTPASVTSKLQEITFSGDTPKIANYQNIRNNQFLFLNLNSDEISNSSKESEHNSVCTNASKSITSEDFKGYTFEGNSEDHEKLVVNCTSEINIKNDSGSIWSSVANLVKTVFSSLSSQSRISTDHYQTKSLKRVHSDDDGFYLDTQSRLKKMKFTDIQCRPTVRDLKRTPYSARRSRTLTKKKLTVDKSTQTDEDIN